MTDDIVIDKKLKQFVRHLKKKYNEEISSLIIDHRKTCLGRDYICFVILNIKEKHRGKGIAKKIILEVLEYADQNSYQIQVWASNLFGIDIERWMNFLKNIGFIPIDKENNIVYFSKNIF
jgi:GNAT superfamily N-acetyltransferase